jgi:hypothetical protein
VSDSAAQARDDEREVARGNAAATYVLVGVLVLAVPVSAWWLVGDRSPTLPDPDYLVRPPNISKTTEHVIGITATALLIVTVSMLVRLARQGRFDARLWSALAPLVGAGVIIALGWRIVTAAVIGANIGGGFVLMFGPPLVFALIVWAVARAWHLGRTP